MAYQLHHSAVPDELKRIALEEIAGALEQLRTPQDNQANRADRADAIHDARKRFKKLRALLRLVRDDLGKKTYRRENRRFRDAGRELSAARDAHVLLTTVTALEQHFGDQLYNRAFGGVKGALEQHAEAVRTTFEHQDKTTGVIAMLEAGLEAVPAWPLTTEGFGALEAGLRREYRRGQVALRNAYSAPADDTFHTLRKGVKVLWYHLQLVTGAWPALLTDLAKEAHHLSELLGSDHDLAVLHAHLLTTQTTDDATEVDVLKALVKERQTQLRAAAYPLAARLYAEPPAQFGARVGAYWQAWQRESHPAEPVTTAS